MELKPTPGLLAFIENSKVYHSSNRGREGHVLRDAMDCMYKRLAMLFIQAGMICIGSRASVGPLGPVLGAILSVLQGPKVKPCTCEACDLKKKDAKTTYEF